MNQNKKINVGSYIKVIRGAMSGEVYKVFSISSKGTFIGVGILNATDTVNTNDIIIVSEDTFDKVNHDILMYKLSKDIKDKRVLKLIRKYLQSGIMINGIVTSSEVGTPQGGPLSPLLSNIMLDELDRELEKRGHKFCRYADDCNI